MRDGLQVQLSYSLANFKDASSAPVTGDTYVNSIAVPLLLSKSYRIGACDFDVRNTVVGTVIWNVPGPKSGLASYVAGGWEIGSIRTPPSRSAYTVTLRRRGAPLHNRIP